MQKLIKNLGFWILVAAVLAVFAIALCFLTDPVPERMPQDIPEQTYKQSEVQLRVTEQCNPTVTFSGATQDTETEFAVYHFDPAIPEEELLSLVLQLAKVIDGAEAYWDRIT